MTFTRTANVLTSADGRFRIEGMRDHRGVTYVSWLVEPLWDLGWIWIANTESAAEAKEVCLLAARYGGTA